MLARVAVRRSVISAALFGGNACTMAGGPRLPPQVPPHLDAPQRELFDAIVDSRMRIVGRDALFDEAGALRGPWNPEVASPALGRHLERLATAVRAETSLEARVYEVAILAIGAHWRAQFEWYAHEKLARAAGVAEAAFPLVKARAPPEALAGVLAPDELAAYALARELMATQRVSDATYAAAKAALGSDRAMADLAMTMGCYSAVSTILNVFEVALPAGAEHPFPEPEA